MIDKIFDIQVEKRKVHEKVYEYIINKATQRVMCWGFLHDSIVKAMNKLHENSIEPKVLLCHPLLFSEKFMDLSGPLSNLIFMDYEKGTDTLYGMDICHTISMPTDKIIISSGKIGAVKILDNPRGFVFLGAEDIEKIMPKVMGYEPVSLGVYVKVAFPENYVVIEGVET